MSEAVVHIVDDEDAVRDATALIIRLAGLRAVCWSSGDEFLHAANIHAPGCALLDLRMPGMDGLAVQEELAARGSTLAVILITGHGDIATAVSAMKSGAIDFLEKPYDDQILVDLVRRALSEQRGRSAVRNQEAKARIALLTPRECQVLLGLTAGKANKAIAHELGVSPRTVEMHRAHLMDRLGVNSLSEALRIAFDAGLMAG